MPGIWDDPWADDEESGQPSPAPSSDVWADPWADEPEPTPAASPQATVQQLATPAPEPPAPVTPPEQPEEPAWYETVLDKGAAFLEGLTKGGTLMPRGAFGMEGLAKAPGMEGHRQRMEAAAKRNPLTRAAGELTTGVGMGVAAPAGFAGQGLAGAIDSGLSEYGRSHSLRKAGGAALTGGVVGGTLGKLTGALSSPARQSASVERALTRDSPEAASALDAALMGDPARGTAGSGMDYAVQRARELMPGRYPDLKELQGAANQAIAGKRAPLGALDELAGTAPAEFRAYQAQIDGLARDPKNYGMMGRVAPGEPASPFQQLMGARDALNQAAPGSEAAMREWTADTALAGMNARSSNTRSLLDKLIGARTTGGQLGILAREGLDRLPFYPKVGRGISGAGGAAAGYFGGAATSPAPPLQVDKPQYGPPPGQAPTQGQAITSPIPAGQPLVQQLSDQGAPASPIEPGEEKAYAGPKTRAYVLEQVMQETISGMSPEDGQAIVEALTSGNNSKLSAIDFRLRNRYPAYARRIEEELKALRDAN